MARARAHSSRKVPLVGLSVSLRRIVTSDTRSSAGLRLVLLAGVVIITIIAWIAAFHGPALCPPVYPGVLTCGLQGRVFLAAVSTVLAVALFAVGLTVRARSPRSSWLPGALLALAALVGAIGATILLATLG